jgi:hypothetical protein
MGWFCFQDLLALVFFFLFFFSLVFLSPPGRSFVLWSILDPLFPLLNIMMRSSPALSRKKKEIKEMSNLLYGHELMI